MTVTLFLTRDCNLRCKYCYACDARSGRMSLQTAFDAVTAVAGQSDGELGVRFFGGEPMLEWESIPAIVDHTLETAATKKVLPSFAISTNGTLLKDEHLDFFEQHDFEVGISMDGAQSVHDSNRRARDGRGSFDVVRDRFRLALQRNLRLTTEIVIDPSTIESLGESVRYLVCELGVRFIIFSVNILVPWPARSLAQLGQAYTEVADFYIGRFRAGRPFCLDMLNNKMNVILRGGYCRDTTCRFGYSEVAVSPDGRIYPCLRLVCLDRDGSTVIGSTRTGIDEDRRQLWFARWHQNPKRCEACPDQPFCLNWCGSGNHSLTGNPADPGQLYCEYERIVIGQARRALAVIDLSEYRKQFAEYLGGCGSKGIPPEAA